MKPSAKASLGNEGPETSNVSSREQSLAGGFLQANSTEVGQSAPSTPPVTSNFISCLLSRVIYLKDNFVIYLKEQEHLLAH